MNIEDYKILISNLPVKQQCFKTKRSTWSKAENEFNWLKQLNDNLFNSQSIITISRQDIFETESLREAIIKTIYWGYTSGMRGNHFTNILKHIDIIENTFQELRQIKSPTTDDFGNLNSKLKKVTGLGLSTYSKLLYFLQIKFNNNPCLILDQRIIDVFASKTYIEFKELNGIRYYNAEKSYLDFLRLANQISKEINTNGENIELFLFIFGNNLKRKPNR